MKELETEYNEIVKKRQSILDELTELRNDEKVKSFLDLQSKYEELGDKQTTLYKEMKFKEYDNCKHIFVCSSIDFDEYEMLTYRCHGCIKCGLDDSVTLEPRELIPFSRQVMSDYLKDKYHIRGIKSEVLCDLDLGKAIYNKIINNNPHINDKTALKYFEIALDNIRNIKVSEERKKDRAKRLSLYDGFNSWYSKDVSIK